MMSRKSFNVGSYAIVSGAAGFLLCYVAFLLEENGYWMQLALGLGTSAFGLAIGLVILNIYVQGNTQRCAIRAFLVWTYPVMRDRHNLVKDTFWPAFGKLEWENILKEFSRAQFDGTTLSRQRVAQIMFLLAGKERKHRNICNEMDLFLIEMEFLFGWTFDSVILEKIFLAKADFREFKGSDFANTSHHQDICKSYLAAEIHCLALVSHLFKILHVDIKIDERLPLDVAEIIGTTA